ncbi:MAG: hypothetical protein U1E05_27460, partial [Patescibacteria group bacterium]|nr:hypothetical protein [Patescibacteria group bacterium]
LPFDPTSAEQYAVLAAIHDVCGEAGRGLERIDPWAGDDAESRIQGIPYHVLMSQVVPPPHGIGRRSEHDSDEQPVGVTEEEAERLTAMLEGLTPKSTRAETAAINAGLDNDTTTGPPRQGDGSNKRKNVNARMFELLQKDLYRVSGWTSRQWAEELRCSRPAVVATPAWKDLAIARERQKAERKTDRQRRKRPAKHD